jgi:2-hydroxycyclohexanecarboxyl-CoA dehydrogenase
MTGQAGTALVTGAARGIGAAIAARLAAAGYAVAVCDLDGEAAKTVAASLAEQHGVVAVGVAVDISDSAAVAAAVARVNSELGPVDVLVNNAAVDVIERFVDSTEATWDRIIAVNLRGTITVTRAVLDQMIERGSGRIVHIASDARHGITVNSVCPGPTDTALLGQVAAYSERMYEATVKAIPLRRVAEPDEIAGVVAFLASADAAYLTGQTVSVSGGLTMV